MSNPKKYLSKDNRIGRDSVMLGPNGNPRENLMLALRHEEPYWLPCPLLDGSVVSVHHGLTERCDHGDDSWGVKWELKDLRSDSFPVNHPIESPDMVEDYPLPSPEKPQIIEGAKKTASKVNRKTVILFGDNGWGLFERSWLLLGMPRFFVWSFRYPDALKRLIERIAEVKVALTERLITEVGVDIVGYGDDWGMETRLLLSPERWKTFIKPWQAKLYKVVREYGVRVYQHSDGRVEDIVPDLIEIGVDLLNIQRECNDWRRLLEEYSGRLTMWGGVSARTLDMGDPEDIVHEVEECSRLGKHGGVILAPGHALKYPEEKLEIMRKTWMEKGWYRVGSSQRKPRNSYPSFPQEKSRCNRCRLQSKRR